MTDKQQKFLDDTAEKMHKLFPAALIVVRTDCGDCGGENVDPILIGRPSEMIGLAEAGKHCALAMMMQDHHQTHGDN